MWASSRRSSARADRNGRSTRTHDATVGGVIAAGVSSFRRLRLGHVRDTVVELETGPRGRPPREERGPHREERHRLRPAPAGDRLARDARRDRAGRAEAPPAAAGPSDAHDRRATGSSSAAALLEAVPLPSAVIAEPGRVRVWLEGWTDEVEEQTAAARTVAADLAVDHHPVPFDPHGIDAPTIVEAAVTPSRIADVVADRDDWTALLGVGLVWFALDGNDPDAAGRRPLERGGRGGHRPGHQGIRRPGPRRCRPWMSTAG